MDTCIALRTMLVKEGIVYLQAGEFCHAQHLPQVSPSFLYRKYLLEKNNG